MRRGRAILYIAFILILVLAAIAVVYIRFIQPAAQQPTVDVAPPTPLIPMVNVVVIVQPVTRGTVLEDAHLGVVEIPENTFAVDSMFGDVGDVVGRQVRYDLQPNTPVTKSMLVDKAEQLLADTGSPAALSIPRGMVAVSIPISRLSSISYAPQSGDHVNVIVTMMFIDVDEEFQSALPNQSAGVIAPGTGELGTGDTGGLSVTSDSLVALVQGGSGIKGRTEIDPILGQTFYFIPSELQRPRLASQTLLQDAIVLKIGRFPLPGEIEAAAQPTPDPSVAEGEQPTPVPLVEPKEITLIVSPQDAVTLNYLMYAGGNAVRLSLALRSSGDDTRVQTEAVTLQFLLDQYRIPVPAKLPYGLEPKPTALVDPSYYSTPIP